MKIYIHQKPASLLNEIYLVNEPTHFSRVNIIQFMNFREDGTGIVHEETRSSDGAYLQSIKPTMILGEQETRDMISAFSELARERGFEYDSESKAKGKLEAIEKHLEDMRRLVFKK